MTSDECSPKRVEKISHQHRELYPIYNAGIKGRVYSSPYCGSVQCGALCIPAIGPADGGLQELSRTRPKHDRGSPVCMFYE